DTVHLAELAPRQRISRARNEPVADHRDRPLAAIVDERLRAALMLVSPGRMDAQPERRELLERAMPQLVVAQRGEELGRTREPRELHRGNRSAARGLRPPLGCGDDLPR